MIKLLKRGYNTKICLIQGDFKWNQMTFNIINIVKKINSEAKLFGSINSNNNKIDSKFEQFGDYNNYSKSYFYPRFNYDIDPRSPLFLPLIFSNINIIKKLYNMYSYGFFKNFQEWNASRTDMVITIGNELLSIRILDFISRLYKTKNIDLPLRIHIDSINQNFKYDHHEHFDLLLYTTNIKKNYNNTYQFPSQFIGKQNIFDSLNFLNKNKNNKFIEINNNSIVENNRIIIKDIRNKFRNENFINNDNIIFLLDIGCINDNIKEYFKIFKIAIQKFITKNLMNTELSKYGIIITIPEDIKEFNSFYNDLKNIGINVKIIIGNDNNQKYKAFCSADYGAVINNDDIYEASVFQLPSVILNNSSYLSSYIKLLYNVSESDINWTDEGIVVPETLGCNFGKKLAELWDNFDNDENKYYLSKRIHKVLLKMLPTKSNYIGDKKLLNDIIEKENIYINPTFITEVFIKEKYNEIKNIKEKSNSFQIKNNENILYKH